MTQLLPETILAEMVRHAVRLRIAAPQPRSPSAPGRPTASEDSASRAVREAERHRFEIVGWDEA